MGRALLLLLFFFLASVLGNTFLSAERSLPSYCEGWFLASSSLFFIFFLYGRALGEHSLTPLDERSWAGL